MADRKKYYEGYDLEDWAYIDPQSVREKIDYDKDLVLLEGYIEGSLSKRAIPFKVAYKHDGTIKRVEITGAFRTKAFDRMFSALWWINKRKKDLLDENDNLASGLRDSILKQRELISGNRVARVVRAFLSKSESDS